MTADISLLKSFSDGQGAGAQTYVGYTGDFDSNFVKIEAAFNALNAEFRAFGGQNSLLLFDLATTLTLAVGFIGAGSFVPSFTGGNTQLSLTRGEALTSVGRVTATTGTTLTGSGTSGTRIAALRLTGVVTLETAAGQGVLDLYSVNWNGASFDTNTLVRLPGTGANNIIVDADDFQAARVQESFGQGTNAALGAFTYDRIADRINDIVRLLGGQTTSGAAGQATLKPIAFGGTLALPGLILGAGATQDPATGLYRAAANTLGVVVQANEAVRYAQAAVGEPQQQVRAGTALATPPAAYVGDPNTGFGWVSADRHRAIAGGLSAMEWNVVGGVADTAVPGTMSGLGANRWGNLPESIKTGAYTVVATDRGALITGNSATGFTLSLTAAATLGAGFCCTVRNLPGALGPVIIDPAGAEAINGVSTLTLFPGRSAVLACTGTEWRALVISDSRDLVTAARTYYVRADGNNANTGLVDAAGGAFLTLAGAFTALEALALDLGNSDVILQVRNGTFAGGTLRIPPLAGLGTLSLVGDPTTPANVTINSLLTVEENVRLRVRGFTFANAGGGAIRARRRGTVVIDGNNTFGVCTGSHLRAEYRGRIELAASYGITGSAPMHFDCDSTSDIFSTAAGTVTLTGTPAFATAFARAQLLGLLAVLSGTTTFSGAATGKRYDVLNNGAINTNGGGANFFPGSIAGTGTPYV